MMKRLLPLVLLVSCVVSDGKDQMIEKRQLTVPLDGASKIVFNVTSGHLEIVGEQRDDVALTAEFWGEVFNPDGAQALLKNMTLTHGPDEGALLIRSRVGEGSLGEDGWINLTARVPATIPLEVIDQGGDIVVRNIEADVEIDDAWGDITVEDITGALTVDDSSGDLEIFRVSGKLRIIDSYGDITVEDTGSDIEIDDGYGDILVVRAGGSVNIEDLTGDVLVRVVEGDLEVRGNRRGEIVHEGVKGKVKVPQRRGG